MFACSSTVVAAILACGATAQLILPQDISFHDNVISNVVPDTAQHPLLDAHHATSTTLSPYKAGQFTLTPQGDSICTTHGESQWTGTIDVTDTHRLFFWFFDSRHDPENDPIIIWLNGGPGGSSMIGLFTEMGPCWLEPTSNATIPNEFSWNNNASLLFIDQPAGVGFSSLAGGAPIPSVDTDGQQDFQMFLNIFFSKVFPERAHLPIHLAAESYGGHYGPIYLKHILESRRYDSKTAFWGNITSLILVDAAVDMAAPAIGAYELLCLRADPILDEQACNSIRSNIPKLRGLAQYCEMSYDEDECWGMFTFAEEKIHIYYNKLTEEGKRSSYNINRPCSSLPLCEDASKGNVTAYLNQEWIKEALHFPSSYSYTYVNMTINEAYSANKQQIRPTTREVAYLLDAHLTPDLGDIRVLVMQGNDDYVLNTPGNIWTYDNVRWTGQSEYCATRWQDLPREIAASGSWKGTEDGRLVFVVVDGAGHFVPGDVSEGAYKIAQKWIEGGWRKSKIWIKDVSLET
ncbi:Carboxypeptidase Y-like protein [Cladobotryum mycophilum]|uniref:Carboxypeptidase n=1 Tax=Cladobotryum mycophilum TaxID=491253 RepID=A0ABR0SSZ4_9HYPO